MLVELELLHEPVVGVDDGSPGLDILLCLLEVEFELVHEEGHHNGSRLHSDKIYSADAPRAVHQNSPPRRHMLIYKLIPLGEVIPYPVRWHIRHPHHHMLDAFPLTVAHPELVSHGQHCASSHGYLPIWRDGVTSRGRWLLRGLLAIGWHRCGGCRCGRCGCCG